MLAQALQGAREKRFLAENTSLFRSVSCHAILEYSDVPSEYSSFPPLIIALIKGASESLAGRAALVDVSGFSIEETGAAQMQPLWVRGSFPRSFLATSEPASQRWRQDFIRTFLERDLPQLGISIPSETMLRFWTMLAHFHGQTWNGSELARALSSNDKSLRHYLDLLTGAQVIRQLQPWHENIGKRQVKSPKVYVRDSGLLHALLDIPS